MRKYILAAISGLLMLVMSVGLVAQGKVSVHRGTGQRVSFVEAWRPNRSSGSDTRIIGTVIDISQNAVSRAKVQLRNLSTGTVDQEQTSDENGAYAFDVLDPGTYVVEMVMVDGYVVALSNAGSLGRFETFQTVIQLPGRWNAPTQSVVIPQNVTNFVGMSAQNTMAASTIELAVVTNVPAADAGAPVSP